MKHLKVTNVTHKQYCFDDHILIILSLLECVIYFKILMVLFIVDCALFHSFLPVKDCTYKYNRISGLFTVFDDLFL